MEPLGIIAMVLILTTVWGGLIGAIVRLRIITNKQRSKEEDK